MSEEVECLVLPEDESKPLDPELHEAVATILYGMLSCYESTARIRVGCVDILAVTKYQRGSRGDVQGIIFAVSVTEEDSQSMFEVVISAKIGHPMNLDITPGSNAEEIANYFRTRPLRN
jgi:hypothetical protein